MFSPAEMPVAETEARRLFSYRRIRAEGAGDSASGYKIGSIEYIPEVSTDLVNWLSGPEYLEETGEPVDKPRRQRERYFENA